jgi:hypothetical protein
VGEADVTWALAQLNVAQMREPLDSPVMADFVGNLDRINALADNAPGFVWRLQDEAGNATSSRPFGELLLVNLSVWDSIEALEAYAYHSAHVEIMRRRREWFERMEEAFVVLWWVPPDHRPTVDEAAERLTHLRTHGPTPHAFTFRTRFSSPVTTE